MVGLNHEMARELLWNEFPTDQRGSYFRQFWDVSMMLPPDADSRRRREALRDIPELHTWSQRLRARQHTTARAGRQRGAARARDPRRAAQALPDRGDLRADARRGRARSDDRIGVLVDLLTPAEEDVAAARRRSALPLFEAKVDPDIYFIGFDLTRASRRAARDAADDPGWFFVIKERPGEPRFGMDDVDRDATKPRLVNWNDLARGRDARDGWRGDPISASIATRCPPRSTLRRPLPVIVADNAANAPTDSPGASSGGRTTERRAGWRAYSRSIGSRVMVRRSQRIARCCRARPGRSAELDGLLLTEPPIRPSKSGADRHAHPHVPGAPRDRASPGGTRASCGCGSTPTTARSTASSRCSATARSRT